MKQVIIALIASFFVAYAISEGDITIPGDRNGNHRNPNPDLNEDPHLNCEPNEFWLDGQCLGCYGIMKTIGSAIHEAVNQAKQGCTVDEDCDFHPAQTKFFGKCLDSIMKDKFHILDDEVAYWDNQYPEDHEVVCGYVTPMCLNGEPVCNLDTHTCEETFPDVIHIENDHKNQAQSRCGDDTEE